MQVRPHKRQRLMYSLLQYLLHWHVVANWSCFDQSLGRLPDDVSFLLVLIYSRLADKA